MRYVVFALLSIFALAISCKEEKLANPEEDSNADIVFGEIYDRTFDKATLKFEKKTSTWTLDDEVYSGYAVSFHKNGSLKEKTGILNGRKENQDSSWYANGQLRQTSSYHNGKLDGEKKVWISDTGHVLISYLNYRSGRPHGEQRTWYPSGELHKKLNLNMGKEEGIQQAYRKNGALYANYEAKNGRIFGLKKATLCYGLEDEKMAYER